MKKTFAFVAIMAVVLAFSGFGAYAADVKASVTGKVEVKTEKVDGKDAKVSYVKVSEAKGDDGKDIADLKGKDLKVTGAKAADAEKLSGKEVTAKGTVKDNKSIDATSVEEKAAPAAAAPAAAPAK